VIGPTMPWEGIGTDHRDTSHMFPSKFLYVGSHSKMKEPSRRHQLNFREWVGTPSGEMISVCAGGEGNSREENGKGMVL
jgi:hypothetical protein